ncbi:MAG TPA: DUF1501 domain-containing protein [Phnomibacter sp.]|nr:DUF1501 domain-containing protein [Phnomibacter sp.]
MHIKRRNFLINSSLATAGTLMVPQFLQAMYKQKMPMGTAGNKVLIVIQLSGGNDGLNTVIPIRNDVYYQKRPGLGITKDKATILTDEAGLNPALTAFKTLYDNGELAILNDVGYPNPDRSHFRSMDIWHTASASNEIWNTGWLGRYLDAQCANCSQPTQILELDDVLSLAMKGETNKGIAFQDPSLLFKSSNAPFFKDLTKAHTHHDEPVADYLYKTLADTVQSADMIFKASKMGTAATNYPATGLGKSLKTIGALIAGGMNTSVYYVSLGSFDTHVNQAAQQNRLLTELNGAVEAFVKDMKQQGRFDDVLMMSFSEFGRRVGQNASAGTDHGTANNMFFVGGSLKQKGLLNTMPTLLDLENGDLKYRVDFRNVLATVLENWLGTPSKSILKGSFAPMQFV